MTASISRRSCSAPACSSFAAQVDDMHRWDAVNVIWRDGAGEGGGVVEGVPLDDHELVRRGVRDLLEAEGDIEVVGEAATATEALERIPALSLMSPCSTCACPTATASRCAATSAADPPRDRCLMLTSFADDEALFDAIMAGAAGYVLKQIRGDDLVDAIRGSATASRCSTQP